MTASRILVKGSVIYGVVVLVGLLLLTNTYLLYKNSLVIERNKTSYERADLIKVNTVDILRELNLVDMLLRSYALTRQEQFLHKSDSAFSMKDSVFRAVERPLLEQDFPMGHFYAMRDSVNAYYGIVTKMRNHLVRGEHQKFLGILQNDPGFDAWLKYRDFANYVNAFEDQVSADSDEQYKNALHKSYFMQFILFLIAVPTLVYTAFYSVKSIKISNLLRRSTEENNRILRNKNIELDKLVAERTFEIHAQNEEISAYNEEISAHNEQLLMQQQEIEAQQQRLEKHNEALEEARRTIEQKNREIQLKNEELATEVEHQTRELRETNMELIEHNSRLEQFAYIISHNLRAPVARLVGLSSILEHAATKEEYGKIIKMMIKSTNELDVVIQDLSAILRIQKMSVQVLNEVKLKQVIDKVTDILEADIKETQADIICNLQDVDSIFCLPQYFESIIYNLISNSIKYRHPERPPVIRFDAAADGEFICIKISDNGLGIDLKNNRNNLFNLYKRFHFHVEGKGLGLYLVKTQADALGARIEVDSLVDNGTTFTLYFKKHQV